jgi:putative zinc finger/helix-turn-helix YgiT family protein
MKCFECEKGKLTVRVADVPGEVKDEKYTVRTEALVCNQCGAQVLTDAQSAAYTVAIADAYREQHGLLTSRELKNIRQRFGLSQRAFARRFRGISLASLKRWEAGAIQDEAHDELLRSKTDLRTARRNLKDLEDLALKPGAGQQMTDVRVQRPGPRESEWGGEQDVEIAAAIRRPLATFTTCYGA